MKKETIIKLLRRILNQDIDDIDISYFPYEESKGHYKNIYKINASDNNIYILKKAKGDELNIYSSINNMDNHIPYYYGSYHYYNNDYILFSYIKGHNAMKMDKDNLFLIIDAIIDVQKKYWLSPLRFAYTLEEALKKRYERLSYLPVELKGVYEQYIDCFKKTPITFSHEDLLPFNVLINKTDVTFIDLEVGGILPYPTMLCRLISHTSDDKKALFYLDKSLYQEAISYYYNHFIKDMGIDYQNYLKTMNLFIYHELLEWIYVYHKYHYPPNDFYNSYYQKALYKITEINNQ